MGISNSKNIVITGVTGFIGQALFKSIKSLHKIKTVSRYTSRLQSDFKIESLDKNQSWSSVLDDMDVIIHLAGMVHLPDSNVNTFEKYIDINTLATLNLAEQAAKNNIRRFIYISTVTVFGDISDNPYKIMDDTRPRTFAAKSKLFAENGLKVLAKKTGMEVVIIRSPLVYGPGVKANFAAIMKLASTGIPLPFGGINKNKRSMVYIDNLVDLIITCISHPSAANQTFLVSDDDDLSTARMIKELSLALGKKSWMLPVPVKLFALLGKITGKSAMVERLCGSLQVDISKTKQLLDWKPPFSVKEGFTETAKHFLQNK